MSNVLHAPCDAATAQARDEAGQTDHPRFVIATTILASSLAFVDGSVVNVGLPAIGASFRADADQLQWVVNAYLLPLSALLLLVSVSKLLESTESVGFQRRWPDSRRGRRCGRLRTDRNTIVITLGIRATSRMTSGR